MNFFNKLKFHKKEYSNSTTNNNPTISDRKLSKKLSEKLESSIIPFWSGQLYMHYWSDSIIPNDEDQEWRNQGLYFWKIEEQFPKNHYRKYLIQWIKESFV